MTMSDYISREALKKEISESTEPFNTGSVFRAISRIPAADVAEVRRGWWTEIKEHIYPADGVCKEWTNFYCSECDVPNNSPTDFCPNCGAKMDLEDEK